MSLLAVDLGGTKLAIAAFADDGTQLHRDTRPVAGSTGRDVGALIVNGIDAVRARTPQVTAVGVCIPGLYRAGQGSVWAPNIPGWDDYPLRDELRAALGRDIRVAIGSDRAACILGETWRGAARGARDAIYLAVGTGIGAGILAGGHVLDGHDGTAGAIGWLAMGRPWRGEYERCGHFEYHASGPGLVSVARELMDDDPGYAGALRHVATADLTTAMLFEAYERGDAIARRAIDDAIELWGMAAANLVSLFDPEVIVFGGGVFGPATRYLDRIEREARRWAQPIAMRRVKLVASALGTDAALLGAARLASIPS